MPIIDCASWVFGANPPSVCFFRPGQSLQEAWKPTDREPGDCLILLLRSISFENEGSQSSLLLLNYGSRQESSCFIFEKQMTEHFLSYRQHGLSPCQLEIERFAARLCMSSQTTKFQRRMSIVWPFSSTWKSACLLGASCSCGVPNPMRHVGISFDFRQFGSVVVSNMKRLDEKIWPK